MTILKAAHGPNSAIFSQKCVIATINLGTCVFNKMPLSSIHPKSLPVVSLSTSTDGRVAQNFIYFKNISKVLGAMEGSRFRKPSGVVF